MKKIIALSILFLGSLFLIWNGQQQKIKTQQTVLEPTTQTPAPLIETAPIVEIASWKTYTNSTFGYSIKYPATWTVKQAKVFDSGVSEDKKDMAIEFYNNDILMLQILTDYKTKVGDPVLSSLVLEVPTPMDKTTVSDVMVYKIGNLDGYRRLVITSDPLYQGLEYITKDSKYIYHMRTFNKIESVKIVNMLKTFTTK